MKKILLIEDNQDVRENTQEILELANYSVVSAENGKDGVEVALRENPDLIICDIMMPVLDGYGVLHLLSKNEKTAAIPFIFMSAKSEKKDIRKGIEMGADDYITKPFDDIELLNAIETRLKKVDLLKKSFEQAEDNGMGFDWDEEKMAEIFPSDYELLSFRKKEVIYHRGKRPSHLYFVKSGKVKTYLINEDGKELITDIHVEKNFFGYTSILQDCPYEDAAEALESTELIGYKKSDFLNLIQRDPTLSRLFIRLIARNVSEKENHLLHLAYSSLRKRVAEAILSLYERYRKENESRTTITISREDLAHLVGTATESLIRTLSDFKSEKRIEIIDGKIVVSDLERLRNLPY